MNPTILDRYILSLVDRGLKSKYELQRKGGVSLGSSSPAIRRMQAAKLIVQTADGTPGMRPRHELKLTLKGKRLVQCGWKKLLAESTDADFESALRLADMARHYGSKQAEITQFLRGLASKRAAAAKSRSRARHVDDHRLAIIELLNSWSAVRLQTESTFLRKLASSDSSDRSAPITKRNSAKLLAKKV